MRRLAIIFFLGCGAPDGSRARPVTPDATDGGAVASTEAGAELSVEATALRFARAAFAGDAATARALALTYAELVELTVRPPARARFDDELAHALAAFARVGDGTPVRVRGASLRDTRTLAPPADTKVRAPLEVARVHVQIEHAGRIGPYERDRDGARVVPLMFVRTTAGWRFTPKP